jgi:outer membrane protein OmpA-like peptidoglycan-associated protein
VNDHAVAVIVALIAVSIAIGLLLSARAWQDGSNLSTAQTARAWVDWIGLGFAHGLVFIAVYALILVSYRTRAPLLLSVAVYAGFFAWLAFSLLDPIKGRSGPSLHALERLHFRWGAAVALAGVVLAAASWLLHEDNPLQAVVVTGTGALVYLLAVGFLPLCSIEELHGPMHAERVTTDHAAPDSAQSKDAARRVSMAILTMTAFSVPLIADIAFLDFSVSTAVFRGLGLRSDNASVRLKGESLSTVRAQARSAGVQLSVCAEPDGSAIVAPITVLWHGMGKRSLLVLGQFRPRESDKSRAEQSQVEVNSEELKLLQTQGHHCRDMKQEIFFRSGKVEGALSAQERALAAEVEDVFLHVYPTSDEEHASGWRWTLERVLIVGHADPMPLGDAANEGLARRRAACVARQVVKVIDKRGMHAFEDADVQWEGEGARSPSKLNCPLEGSHSALVECHAANRFANVRIIFSCKDASGKPFNGCEMGTSGPVDKYKPAPVVSEQARSHAEQIAADAATECENPSFAVGVAGSGRQR